MRALGGGAESQICPWEARLLLIPCPPRPPLSASSTLSPSLPLFPLPFADNSKARPGLPLLLASRPGEPPHAIRPRFVSVLPDSRADLTAALGVSAEIHHEGGEIKGRRQGRCQVRITTLLSRFSICPGQIRSPADETFDFPALRRDIDFFLFGTSSLCRCRLAVKSKGAEKPAKGRKGKAGKDPNKPKRAPSAFFVFMYVRSYQLRFFFFLFSLSFGAAWLAAV